MYFPYFYARRSELLALRDISDFSKLQPVLEPVVEKPNDLIRGLDHLRSSGGTVYLVQNPETGPFAGNPRGATTWYANLGTIWSESFVRPSLLVGARTTRAEVINFIASYPGREVGLVVRATALAPADLVGVVTSQTMVFIHKAANPRMFVATLGAANTVLVSDAFITQERNADYGAPEWLSSDNTTFATDGHPGFSDFTVLSSSYRPPGGGPIGAMVIHLSFVDPRDGSIWVEHFVSDTTAVGTGDLHSKFMESLEKVESRIATDPGRFLTSEGLRAYRSQYSSGATTSLGGNKRQEISHHLTTAVSTL